MSALGKFNNVMRFFGLVLVKTIDDNPNVPVKWSVWRWSRYVEWCERVSE